MILWNLLNPFHAPSWIDRDNALLVHQEKVLQGILLWCSLIETGLVISGGLINIQNSNPVLFAIAVGLWAATIGLTIWRRVHYKIRAVLLLGLLSAYGLILLLSGGLSGSGRLFLMTIPVIGVILLGLWGGAITTVISVLAHLVIGIFMTREIISFSSQSVARPGDPTSWVSSLFALTAISFAATAAVYYIVNGLNEVVAKQQFLTQELHKERDNLEKQVDERTTELNRRLVQIQTVAEITRSISSTLDSRTLLQNIADNIQQRLQLYYVGVFLLDRKGENAILRAGTGDAGQKMIAMNHHLQVGGTSMIGWACANRKARIALDVGTEAVRFNNPYLPQTHSEIALPIISREKVLGALSIQSTESNAFDQNDVTILQGVSDSLGVALENARLFQQNQEDLDEIRALNRQYLDTTWGEVVDNVGELTYTFENPDTAIVGEIHPVVIPITLRDQMIGTIELDMTTNRLSTEDAAMVESIASQTALTLESARLLNETQRKAVQEEKINQLSAQFSRAMVIEDIIQTALQELGQLPAVAEVSVHLNPGVKPNTESLTTLETGHQQEQAK